MAPMRVSSNPHNRQGDRRREVGSYWTDFLEKGPQLVGAVKAGIDLAQIGVRLGEAALPYIRPLVLAAAL